MKTPWMLAATLVTAGCIVVPEQRPDGPTPPPMAAPAPAVVPAPAPIVRPMTKAEAVAEGDAYCGARGWECRHAGVERLGPVWRVRLDVRDRAGRLDLQYDAASRALVRADEPPPVVVAPPPAPAPAPIVVAPRPMAQDEAVNRAFGLCRERGFDCRLLAASREGDVWVVELDARRGRAVGTFHVGLDALSRDVIALDEPREPHVLTADEAAREAYEVCRQRGWFCRVAGSSLFANVWRIDLDARRGDVAGPLHVELDAVTRAVQRVDEPRPPPPPPRLISADEATEGARRVCRERGFHGCRPVGTALGGNVWRVDLEARRENAYGNLHVELDAVTRAVLRIDEPAPVVVAPTPMPPGPVPAPPARFILADEAASIALRICQQRAYQCRLTGSALDRSVWRVEVEARRERTFGNFHVEVDAVTRAVLRVDEPQRVAMTAPPPPPPAMAPPPSAPPRVSAPPATPPPAPPPVARGAMGAEDASRLALDWCRERGYGCRVEKVDLVKDGRMWFVKLEAQPPRRGHAVVELDVATRRFVGARDEIKSF
jgi:acetolactate synthase regulatory subunit